MADPTKGLARLLWLLDFGDSNWEEQQPAERAIYQRRAESVIDSDWYAEVVAAARADLHATLAAVERLADEWESDYPSESASCDREVNEWWLDLRDVLNTDPRKPPVAHADDSEATA